MAVGGEAENGRRPGGSRTMDGGVSGLGRGVGGREVVVDWSVGGEEVDAS